MSITPLLETVGDTPLVELQRVVPGDSARVFLKLESANPTGSMKDRMALAVVDGALADGRLEAGGRLVEYTGGSTGTSLAFVCAARGIAATFVSSDAFSREKRDHMRALGANVEEIPSEGGRTTRALIEAMVERARELATAPGAFYADQFRNPDAAGGYGALGREIFDGTGGWIDAFVQSVGTAQCVSGVAAVLRGAKPECRIVAVEPAESPVLSGGESGPHHIEGVGPGFVPPLWRDDLADAVETVSTDEATAMCRRLAREEGLFGGTSTGANVVAALREAARQGPERMVVTLMCDSGLKYLSTALYRVGD